jgi:hypothetical protein
MANSGTDSTKNTLERLLRMEIIASDSYDSAIRRLDAPAQQMQLEDLRRDHDLAVGRLRNLLASMHDASSLRGMGLLGAVVRGFSGLVALLGAGGILRALRSGERAMLGRLEHIDRDPRLAPEARALISGELLPRTREHVGKLDRLLAA